MRRTNFIDHQVSCTGGRHELGGVSGLGWQYADQLEGGHWGVGRLAQAVPSEAYFSMCWNRLSNALSFLPCKQVVATIESKTSLAILCNKYDEVCARLMQAKKNRKLFSGMVSIEFAVVLMNVFLASSLASNSPADKCKHGLAAAAGVVSGVPGLMVAQQFHRIKQKCEAALRARFGDVFYNQIDALVRDEEGFQKAIMLLREQGGDTGFLEQKLAEFQARGYSNSWVAQILMDIALWDR